MCNVYSYMRISTSEERDLQNFTERKQWQKLESIVQPGDTIVFKDICRFTREAEQGYVKYMALLNKGVELILVGGDFDCLRILQ